MAYCFWPSLMMEDGPWASLGPANHRNYGQLKGGSSSSWWSRGPQRQLWSFMDAPRPPILWSTWEAGTCQLSTRPRSDAPCEMGVGILSTQSTVSTCCLPPASSGPPMSAFIQWSDRLLSFHTGSVLHSDLWGAEPGDLEEGGSPCQSPGGCGSVGLSLLLPPAVCLSPNLLECSFCFPVWITLGQTSCLVLYSQEKGRLRTLCICVTMARQCQRLKTKNPS